jgi:hypothetical protein
MGQSHDPNEICVNEAYDTDISEIYCKVQRIVDVMGQSHGQKPNVFCVNEDYDGSDTYCKVQLISDLERQKDAYEWLPSMLDYYWQNGLGSKGVKFLKTTGFINSYE